MNLNIFKKKHKNKKAIISKTIAWRKKINHFRDDMIQDAIMMNIGSYEDFLDHKTKRKGISSLAKRFQISPTRVKSILNKKMRAELIYERDLDRVIRGDKYSNIKKIIVKS